MVVRATFDGSDASSGFAAFFVIMILFYVAVAVFGFYLYWRVAAKAGWPGWYCLGLLIPLGSIVLLVMFAFKEWPVEAENRMLRQQLSYGGYGGAPAVPGYLGYGAVSPGPSQAAGYPPPGPPWTAPTD